MSKELVVWGGTSNFKALVELNDDAYRIIGYFDNNPAVNEPYHGIPRLGGKAELGGWLEKWKGREPHFWVSIAHTHGKARLSIHEELKAHGLRPITAVHRTAFVADTAQIGEGSLLYAMTAVCVDTRIGRCCVVQTRSSVDHDCVVEDGATISSGVTIGGLVHIERFAEIYLGAIILPRLRIGEGAVVGAGAVVRHDVEPYTIVVGNPARVLRKVSG